jgi:hypothetical protein
LGKSRDGAEPGNNGPEAGTGGLTLASLEAPVRLIDDVDATLAAYNTVVPVAATKRFQ